MLRKAIIISLVCIIFFIIVVYASKSIASNDAPWIREYKGSDYVSIRIAEEDGTPSIDQQIAVLEELGYYVTKAHKDNFHHMLYGGGGGWSEDTCEMYPYWLVFTGLGLEHDIQENYVSELEYRELPLVGEQYVPYSDSTYCFGRLNCITPEHYIYVLSQIERISEGNILLENIQSKRTRLTRRLWVAFTINGHEYRFSIPSSQRQFNPMIITTVSEIVGANESGKKLYWMHDEQGVHMVYRSDEELITLAKKTGINFFGLGDNQLPLK